MLDTQWIYDRMQRGFPLDERPFRVLAGRFDCSEQALLDTLQRDLDAGRISRIGAVFAPNVIGVSTLAAMKVAPAALDLIADTISAHPAVSHNYARSGHDYNLWFVAGARDRRALDAILTQLSEQTGHIPLDLPLEREFHIDLGFALSDEIRAHFRQPFHKPEKPPLDDADWDLIAVLEEGLPLSTHPFHEMAARSGQTHEYVLDRLGQWVATGVIRRLGVVLQHRRFGYTRNAMCVWNFPDSEVDAIGAQLAKLAPVTLCYRRRRSLPAWPYNLFAMVHARDDDEIERAIVQFECEGSPPHAILVSESCYKQCGTRYAGVLEVAK